MGEVYRAADTKLKRHVAIKVLPAAFGTDAERLARFRREAEVLAALNHPHIAAIYGFETGQAGPAGQAGQATPESPASPAQPAFPAFIVMELVEGEDLAERLTRGAIPLDEALAIARQVADALEAAHEQGIIHRDLKPANIKVRPDGTVKVLDFGLAKAVESGGVRLQTDAAVSQMVTSPAMTMAGMVLGTAAYMSPEQARGKTVDARADIWAFGCVLYEMLTGRRPFEGEDVMSAIGAAIRKEPEWTALPPRLPAAVRSTIVRCLQKDPKQRARHIGDVRLALEGAFGASEPAVVSAVPQPTRRLGPPLAAAVLVTALATGFGAWTILRPAPVERRAVRLNLAPAAGSAFSNFFALSPDGRSIAYIGLDQAGQGSIWVHVFESGESRPLPRTVGARSSLVWSPDSRSLAYSNGTTFMRIGADGGSAQQLGDVAGWAGGDWAPDDTLVYGRVAGGLAKIPASGGPAVALTEVDASRQETGHTNPSFLSDGKHFVYFRWARGASQAGIAIGALDRQPNEQAKELLLPTAEHAVYAKPIPPETVGHLLYLRDGALVAQALDERTLKLTGEAVQLAESVGVGPATYAQISVSNSGALAYLAPRRDLGGVPGWFDRTGREVGTIAVGPSGSAAYPRLSPDGKRVALIVDRDVWVYDIGGRPPIRVTHLEPPDNAGSPLWTPDGTGIVYESVGYRGVGLMPADGSSTPEKIVTIPGHYHPHDWSADGKELIAVRFNREAPTLADRTWNIVRVPLAAPAQESAILASQTDAGHWGAALSPNKRFMAYVTNSTGRDEVWVRPFPGPGTAERVSPQGGTEPLWSANGRELIYLENDRFMTVKTTTEGAFSFTPPTMLFETPVARLSQPPSYGLAPDGRLLVIKRPPVSSLPLSIIINWQDLPAVRAARGK